MNPNPAQFGGSFQQTPQQPQKGCLGRNWKWMLPVGCLGFLIAFVILVGGIVFAALTALKSSDVYQGALRIARTHPSAVERLGEPIQDGWFVQGKITQGPNNASANLQIPVSGPKASGTLNVGASSDSGAWTYQRLDLVVGGETVSLLDHSTDTAAADTLVAVEDDFDGSSGDSLEEAADGNVNTQPNPSKEGTTISGGVLNGKAISKPQPSYPSPAKAGRAQGTVVVQVLVDETGKVVSATAVAGHPLLRASAVAAAKEAKFAPTLLSGKPVKVSGVLTYNFVLEQ